MAAAKGLSAASTTSPAIAVCVLAALIQEVRPFLRLLNSRRRTDLDFPAWEFDTGEGRGVVALSGVGEEACRRRSERLLSVCRPQVLASVGFAGAITAEIGPGTVIVGNSYWRYSPRTGTLREISVPARGIGMTLANYLADAGIPALAGSLVTAPVILTKAQHREALRHLQHPVLDQETAAAAEVAAAHGVTFFGLRAVTDTSGEEIPGFIAAAVNKGLTPGPGLALAWLARDPRRAAPLAHFWKRSRLAANNLARGLKIFLTFLKPNSKLRGHPEVSLFFPSP